MALVRPRRRPPKSWTSSTGRLTQLLPIPAAKGAACRYRRAPVPVLPADFGKLVADETEKWAKVVKFAGIKAD